MKNIGCFFLIWCGAEEVLLFCGGDGRHGDGRHGVGRRGVGRRGAGRRCDDLHGGAPHSTSSTPHTYHSPIYPEPY